jgi:hypothetical protein
MYVCMYVYMRVDAPQYVCMYVCIHVYIRMDAPQALHSAAGLLVATSMRLSTGYLEAPRIRGRLLNDVPRMPSLASLSLDALSR